ncbi:hypothetical protein [Phytohabitans aurantiacus]|uniref:Uncharacterized protein n=1 Tax=Phytohabitans aurantiacus TaxID=3016789 RepID=A0ABQ5R239_9ACTN|nr:hypothetical protein [Phytohabitans aurantiacus]GLI00844.1 hypothetical protein Pa4123_61200 [Phytohabitans aurantiacus]
MTDEAPTTALLERVLAPAAEVLIVEAPPSDLGRAGAARVVVSGAEISELARLLAVVDGGTGDRCRCLGWPTIVVSDAGGHEIARWTLHHQTGIRGLGYCDAELRDGPALTDWLAARGLTGSLRAQRMLARQDAEAEKRRVRWVEAAPPGLAEAAEAASRREAGAEESLAALVRSRYPDAVERIRTLAAWAGFPPRQPSGIPWHELAPERLLLTEPAESIFKALASAPLTPEQLDGAAELFTSTAWTRARRARIPRSLRSSLIAHVTATGTDPMKFRIASGF